MRSIRFLARTNVRENPLLSAKILRLMHISDTATATGEVAFSDNIEWHRIDDGWCARRFGGIDLFEFITGDNRISDFDMAIEFTLSWEKGYVNNPNDPGGETKYGISKRAYPHLDIKSLTLEQAKEIYRSDYWVVAGCHKMGRVEALVVFDVSVVSGVSHALELHRKTGGRPLLMLAEQLDFYAATKKFGTFGRGWVRRVSSLMRKVVE